MPTTNSLRSTIATMIAASLGELLAGYADNLAGQVVDNFRGVTMDQILDGLSGNTEGGVEAAPVKRGPGRPRKETLAVAQNATPKARKRAKNVTPEQVQFWAQNAVTALKTAGTPLSAGTLQKSAKFPAKYWDKVKDYLKDNKLVTVRGDRGSATYEAKQPKARTRKPVKKVTKAKTAPTLNGASTEIVISPN